MGFAVRDEAQQDVDEDIDIDGEDEVMYGAAQFTEVDVLGTNDGTTAEDEDVEIDGDEDVATQSPSASGSAGPSSGNASLQQLVAEGKIVKKWTTDESELQEVKKTMDEVMGVGETEELNKAVDLARMSGNPAALIKALDHKVKLLVSKITCIDPAFIDDVAGDHSCSLIHFVVVQDLSRPLHRAYRVDRVLAYMLP